MRESTLQELGRNEFREVSLWVLETNERARRFYERLGFTRNGAVKEEELMGRNVEELRYRRRLGAGRR